MAPCLKIAPIVSTFAQRHTNTQVMRTIVEIEESIHRFISDGSVKSAEIGLQDPRNGVLTSKPQ
jgi:hypothetical protein